MVAAAGGHPTLYVESRGRIPLLRKQNDFTAAQSQNLNLISTEHNLVGRFAVRARQHLAADGGEYVN